MKMIGITKERSQEGGKRPKGASPKRPGARPRLITYHTLISHHPSSIGELFPSLSREWCNITQSVWRATLFNPRQALIFHGRLNVSWNCEV
jgi:hypothetical protein